MRRSIFLLGLALLLAWPQHASAAPGFKGSGQVRFRDGKLLADRAIVTLSNVSAPPAGSRYVAWLGNSAGSWWVNLGAVPLNAKGNGTLEWVSPYGEHLLANYSQALITLEPDGAAQSWPATARIVMRGQIAPELMPTLRALVVSGADTPAPDHPGLATGLKEQAKGLASDAGRARDAAKGQLRNSLLRYDEALINRVVGVMDSDYGDHDSNGTVEERGDSYGIARYARTIQQLVRPILSSRTASTDSKERARRLISATDNVLTWSSQVPNLAGTIHRDTNFNDALTVQRDILWLANNISRGLDKDGNGKIEIEQGEGGASDIYSSALDLGRISLKSGK